MVETSSASRADGAERYLERESLGSGGMGEVRAYQDRRIGREIALKRLHPDKSEEPKSRSRFLREARIQGTLEHPSVVPVYDLGEEEDGSLFFTMKRVRGETLFDLLRRLALKDADATSRWSRRRLLEMFARVCLTVHYAHTRGVIHRDLKPGNIMLGEYGEVYVLDWGLAKAGAEPPTSDEREIEDRRSALPVKHSEITREGDVLGTIDYMPLEQLRGEQDRIDARTDVYALGMILYELMVLKRLHHGRPYWEVLNMVTEGIQVRPSERVADVPPEIDAICLRATAHRPEDRFQTARDLADAVERYLDGDRDLALRRSLAASHAEKATLAAGRALAHGARPAEIDAARAEAMHEVMRAVALDPDNAAAQRALVTLLAEGPEELPADARRQMDEEQERERAQAAKLGAAGLASWLLTLPMVLAVGVRSWPPVIVTTVLTLGSIAAAVWIWRSGRASGGRGVLLASLAAATVASTACWLGPFVLVPTAATGTTCWLAIYATRRERPVVVGLGVLAAGVPFLAEALGWIPRGFSFDGAGVHLLERAIELPPLPTTLGLIWVSLSFPLLTGLFLGRLRDSLRQAEKRLFLHAWHMRKLTGA